MALRVKSLRSAEFLCQNGPDKLKKSWNFYEMYLWPLYGLWKFSWPFLFFLRSLIPKKSSGMQKPCVWLVTHPKKNQHKNSILVHCDEAQFAKKKEKDRLPVYWDTNIGLIFTVKHKSTLCINYSNSHTVFWMGFYEDISWESRCCSEIKVWGYLCQILVVFEVHAQPRVKGMSGNS